LIRDEINENSAKCTFAGWGKKQMVRSSDWKLIFNGGSFELYDLKIDPGESNNLINQNPLKAVDLSKRLFSWFINTRQKSMSKSLVIPTKELPEFWRMIYENKSFQFQDE
jgi:hypothetical protein